MGPSRGEITRRGGGHCFVMWDFCRFFKSHYLGKEKKKGGQWESLGQEGGTRVGGVHKSFVRAIKERSRSER